MKKILLILFSLTILTSCSNKQFYLDDEYYKENKVIDITSEELIKLEEEKKSFALFVYTQGCITCFDFQKHLNEFQKENNITVYSINSEEMEKTNISKYVIYSPSVVLLKNGKVKAYLDAQSDDDMKYYKTKEGFTQWFTKYVIIKK